MVGEPAQKAGARRVFPGDLHWVEGTATPGVGASTYALFIDDPLQLGDDADLYPKRPSTSRARRGHRRAALALAPHGLPPHVHLVAPAAAIDPEKKLWRTEKTQSKGRNGYLFNHKALAKVFRAKLLNAITREGLALPARYPQPWVVDCKSVGTGKKALVYLGRSLYRGVIQEKDIVACERGQVTFRYRDSKTDRFAYRTLPGEKFLALILRHVLPKGFRRARNVGFLHPNSKRLIALLQSLVGFDPLRGVAQLKPRPPLCCPCCGAGMKIVKTRIVPRFPRPVPVPIHLGTEMAGM